MIVNRHGKRFVNEKQMNVGLAFAERDRKAGSRFICRHGASMTVSLPRSIPMRFQAKRSRGNRFQAATLEELAAMIDVDPANLVETAHRFGDFARAGKDDDDFDRGASTRDRNRGGDPRHEPNQQRSGPLRSRRSTRCRSRPASLAAPGGPRTNERAEVLRTDGSTIEGLYAAGNVMANCFGSKGIGAGTTTRGPASHGDISPVSTPPRGEAIPNVPFQALFTASSAAASERSQLQCDDVVLLGCLGFRADDPIGDGARV